VIVILWVLLRGKGGALGVAAGFKQRRDDVCAGISRVSADVGSRLESSRTSHKSAATIMTLELVGIISLDGAVISGADTSASSSVYGGP
jgi:hypothetical protein